MKMTDILANNDFHPWKMTFTLGKYFKNDFHPWKITLKINFLHWKITLKINFYSTK